MKKLLILLLIILFLGTGVLGYLWFHGITKKIFILRNPLGSAPVNSIQQHLDDEKPIDVVLLGYGGGNHDGAYLTDSIIAIHIDPKTKKIFLISIPRDVWIKIPTNGTDGGYGKINEAYQDGLDDSTYPNKQKQFTGADGGGKLAEYIFSQVTGLPINYFVGMDFSGFKHTIDTLGGVAITVQPAFDDYSYPIDGKEADPCGHTQQEIQDFTASPSADEATYFPCRYIHLHFDAGTQQMNGERALSYVRSRHSLQDGTDFGRAKRQRNLLVAVKQKIISPTFIPQIIPFITSLGDDLRTDFSLDDVKAFIQNAPTLNKYEIVNLALTDQNYLTDTVASTGQDILEPKDGLDNWRSVHTWIADTISGKQQTVPAVIEVENGTQTVGLAGIATAKLKAHTLKVLDPATATIQNAQMTTITVYDKNVDQKTLKIVKQEFGVNTIIYAPAKQNAYNVLVVLGNDYNKPTSTPTSQP
jgi:LCP family protein required for cell wall assembly